MKKISVKVYTNGDKKSIITVCSCNGFNIVEVDCYKEGEFIVRLHGDDLFDDRPFSQIVESADRKALKFVYSDTLTIRV